MKKRLLMLKIMARYRRFSKKFWKLMMMTSSPGLSIGQATGFAPKRRRRYGDDSPLTIDISSDNFRDHHH